MKKTVIPYLCNLNARWSNKRLIRLLALLLALAIATPVLLRADDDHDRGRFIDPIVGSWIIHIHVATITPSGPLPPDFDNITAFWEDGITTSSDPTQGTAYGLWKKWDLGRMRQKSYRLTLMGHLQRLKVQAM